MTKAEIIEYLYDNHVRADITIEEMADDLSVERSAQPYWNEMIVICDCCGHTIHVKRQCGERKERDGNEAD